MLRVARSSARKERARALNQMRSLVSTAPDEIRTELRGLSVAALLDRCSSYRPGKGGDVLSATKLALRVLARRALVLREEINRLDAVIGPLVEATAPELLERDGVGIETAATLLVAAGDNPQRLRSERTFAHLCGVAPIDASSGKHERHRLSRSGDRQANSALWRIVITRMAHHQPTRDYIARRVAEGLTKQEAIRCLKRYVAREVYNHLPRQQLA